MLTIAVCKAWAILFLKIIKITEEKISNSYDILRFTRKKFISDQNTKRAEGLRVRFRSVLRMN